MDGSVDKVLAAEACKPEITPQYPCRGQAWQPMPAAPAVRGKSWTDLKTALASQCRQISGVLYQ